MIEQTEAISTERALKLALEALELEEAQTHYPSRTLVKAITALREALALVNEVDQEQPAPVASPRKQEPGVKGYAMALNEIALKLRERYKTDLLSTPLWADFEKARNKLASSIAAPQPAPKEPVAEVKAKMTGGNVGIATVIHEIYSPMRHPLVPGDLLYACPVNQAPVGWMHSRTGLFYSLGVKPDESGLLDEPTDKALPVYTSPPTLSLAKRPWVGLTQDEFRDFASTFEYGTGGLIRAIEAKLKEKNSD